MAAAALLIRLDLVMSASWGRRPRRSQGKDARGRAEGQVREERAALRPRACAGQSLAPPPSGVTRCLGGARDRGRREPPGAKKQSS